jgi:hypothetical protein
MTVSLKAIVATAALALLAGIGASSVPASAQAYPPGVPVYSTWQRGWDNGRYDRRHVILGIVTGFSPYRLTIQRRNGTVQTIDLKNGTTIRPIGSTPVQGQRAAIVGYYSNGTFIANRVILRR